jgi:hypothetical protein
MPSSKLARVRATKLSNAAPRARRRQVRWLPVASPGNDRPDQFSKAEIEAMWRALRRNAKLDMRRALHREAWRLLEAAAD